MIQVIHRAFDILEFVATENNRPKLLSEIANGLDLKPGTCANIVKTLVIRGYLEKPGSQKGYILGAKVLTLPSTAGLKETLISASDHIMQSIIASLHENTLLAVLQNGNRIVIHRRNSEQLVQAHTPDEKKAFDSSTGRLLIAMLPDEALEKFIAKYGLPAASLWPNANTKKKFHQQVEKIRRNGYALIEDSVQIVGIATPVYRQQKLVAGLSIYMPSFRFNSRIKAKMIRMGLEAAKKISKNLEEM